MSTPLVFYVSLTAKAMAKHEEMLNFQQGKIAEVQAELTVSQQQLRQQQQIVYAAKKAQVNLVNLHKNPKPFTKGHHRFFGTETLPSGILA